MKALAATAGTILLVCFANAQIVPKPIFPFERLRWEMTITEVKKSLSGKSLQPDQIPASIPAEYRKMLLDTSNLTLLYVDTLYSQSFEINIVFDKKTSHLSRIGAKIVSPDKQQVRSVTEALINRFGKPTQEQSMPPGGYLRTWVFARSKISAMAGSFPFGLSGLFYINYVPSAGKK